MKMYLDILDTILKTGHDRMDRTGVGTRALFAIQMRFLMKDGFPAMTTKKLFFDSMKAELIWFLRGSSDNNELNALGSKIWNGNANADYWKPKARFPGDLGRVYGVQWRKWRRFNESHLSDPKNEPLYHEVDQIAQVIKMIQNNPYDRRMIVTAWNPGELDMMALPPCHMMFQFFAADDKLSIHMYQRSCDMFLGVPFNIASYSLLLHMVAQITGKMPHEVVLTLGDAHIYHNHFDQVKEQLSRVPGKLPKLWLNPSITSIDDFTLDDIKLLDYIHQGMIKAPMAV